MKPVALLLLALSCAGATGAHAQEVAASGTRAERPFLGGWLRESRIVYPLRIGAWEAQGEHRFEQAQFGASVRYKHRTHADRWMDLYVYPAGVLPDARFAQVVASEVESVADARRQAGQRVDEVTPVRTFAVPGPDDALLGALAPKARSAAFALGLDGVPHHSVLAMTVRDMYFLKVRFSAQAKALGLEAVRDEGEGFLAAFAAAVRIVNTGDCWTTLAVVPFPSDHRKPGGLLASAGEGTAQEVWVAEDRLYAAAPETADPGAREAALALGRYLHAALRGRCVDPANINPVVPEGMREMRFEYGTPEGPGPLRPQRRAPTRT